jgi:hypothetical protein
MLWWHYLYSQDPAVLEDVYDLPEEIGLFTEDRLTRDQAGICHVGPTFPPELLDMVRRGYQKIRPLFDNAGHHLTWLAAAAAHLGNGEEARSLLHDFVNTTTLENGMLLQSLDGVIRVFPGVPAGWTAEFASLRAVRAFLVSARMRKGRTEWVRIVSERGRHCHLGPLAAGAARQLEADAAGLFDFPTEAGETLELTPI